MRDAVLPHDDRAVGKAGSNVMGKVAVDCGDDTNQVIWYSTDAAEKIDGGLETSAEKACTCQEKIPDAGRSEVKGRGGRPGSLKDLQVDEVEE